MDLSYFKHYDSKGRIGFTEDMVEKKDEILKILPRKSDICRFNGFLKFVNSKNELDDFSSVVYFNATDKVNIICKIHETYSQNQNHYLSGHRCQKCGFKKRADDQRMTLEEFINEGNKIHGKGTYDYSESKYIDYHTELKIICPKHGEFWQSPHCHLRGEGCRSCGIEKLAKQQRLTLDEIIKRSNEKHGEGTYDYSESEYFGYNSYMKIICPKKGHDEFWQTPHNHINGQGCPKCNNYKGEMAIRNFLTEYNIKFKEQKTFDDCKNIKLLRFDFYVPTYNLCIEYDGIQHFKPIKRSKNMTDEQAKEKLKYVQKHDKIKNKYCNKNNIGLLRIPYYNFDKINNILIDYFNL